MRSAVPVVCRKWKISVLVEYTRGRAGSRGTAPGEGLGGRAAWKILNKLGILLIFGD